MSTIMIPKSVRCLAPMRRGALGALLATGVLLAGSPAPASAQSGQQTCDVPSWDVPSVWKISGEEPPDFCPGQRSPFRLFGAGDFAGTGMRLSDPNLWAFTTNTGLMDTGDFSTIACCTLPMYILGVEAAPSTGLYQYFEVQLFEAAARGDWVRNREIATSLQNVQGGGWTFTANLGRMGSIHMFQGADGSAGLLHGDAVSAAGAGCRDHGGNFVGYPHGFPLLAGNDCPETWGATGWQGRRPVNYEEGWLAEAQEKGNDFAFEFWDVNPANLIPESERAYVGDFQTYGIMSDHGREHRARFGSVIPGQSGDPTLQGYPLGLVWEFNAHSWNIPTVAGMFIYEALLINRSDEVYGVGLDYDSLYVGIEPRWLRGGAGRRGNIHAITEMGAVVGNELGRTDDCDGGLAVPTSVSCSGVTGRSTRGFRAGASGFMFLKTPIGDLRYKNFSDPTSPFFNPAHPLAGDTITFNRMSLCGFECTQGQFSTLSMRRGWGTIAADVAASLDGRDPNLLSIREYWMLFKPAAGSDTRVELSNPRGPGGFNYYIPPENWRYTNRPPGSGEGPDTLFIDNCNPVTNECIGLWSDTLPDQTLNWAYNASWLSVGPFPLAAGDTTAFVVAAFAQPDSARFMSLLENVYNFYVTDFYLGPGVPTPPGIVATEVSGGSRGSGQTGVTLVLDDAASSWRDAFAVKFVDNVRAAAPNDGTPFGRLLALNPDLVERLEAAVNSNNVDRVYLFKSCNGGDTFTATATGDRCPADRATDQSGGAVGTGWEAYAVLTPDERGQFPTTFFDGSVTAGRSYLYSLVAQTDGIELIVDDSVDVDGDNIFDRVERVPLRVLGPSSSTLSTDVSNRQVASLYIPASSQAGATPARAEFTSQRGPLAVGTGLIGVTISGEVGVSDSYRLVFGDSAQTVEYLSPEGEIDSTRVWLYRSARTGFDVNGDPVYTPFAVESFKSTSGSGVILNAGSGDVVTESLPDLVTRRVTALSGVVVREADSQPLFVSSVLTGSSFTPSGLFSRPEFGGFVVSVTNTPGSKLSEQWALLGEVLRSASWPSLEWLDGEAEPTGDQYGELEIAWGNPAFTNTVPVDVRNPDRTEQQYAAVLTGRSTVSRTTTDGATAQLIAEMLGVPVEEVVLADVGLPFTITNTSIGGTEGRPVSVAILEDDLIEEALLGSGVDTLTVPVPMNTWIPGTPLILIGEVDVAQTNGNGQVNLGSDGEPVTTTIDRVTWASAMLGCSDRPTCNPVSGPGQSGYVSIRPDMSLLVDYANPMSAESVFEFDVTPPVVGSDITSLGPEGLDNVRAVPNPYIFFSRFEQESGSRRLMFTNLPPEGRLSIFTAAGQFVQRMDWGPGDLSGNGDLFWNLRTREDTEVAAGLYLFVVEATGPVGNGARKLGKFIIIR